MLQDRVKARIEELKMNAFEAARQGGFTRAFIHDIISGRKQKLHAGNYKKLARLLTCSVEYLRGQTDDPRITVGGEAVFLSEAGERCLPVQGLIEPGALRPRREGMIPLGYAPIDFDMRYKDAVQMAFEIRFNPAEFVIFTSGRSYLNTVDFSDYTEGWGKLRNGDLVVVERALDTNPNLVETTCCGVLVVDGETHLISRFAGGQRSPFKMSDLHTIIAVACRYVQVD